MIKESKLIGTKLSMPYGWHEFKVGDLFDIVSTHALNYDLLQPNGAYPYVVRSAQNNGIREFMNYDTAFLNKGNVITLGIDTASYFYQSSDFFAGVKVKLLRLKHHELNSRIAMFLIPLLQKQAGDYGYAGGKAFNTAELAEVLIELPVTADDMPDYDWMSSYIRELENQRIRELETYLQVTGLDDTILTDNELQVLEQWRQHEKFGGGTLSTKRFAPLELFDFPMAKSLNKDDLIVKTNGSPYVTRTVENNGANMIIDLSMVPDEFVNGGNEFSFGLLGLQSFYQKNPYVAGQFVRRFVPKFDMNETLAMYFKTIIDKLKPELQTTSIKGYVDVLAKPLWELPVTNDGTPDYDFMETFIGAQEKLVMQRLDKFRRLQIDTTKAVI